MVESTLSQQEEWPTCPTAKNKKIEEIMEAMANIEPEPYDHGNRASLARVSLRTEDQIKFLQALSPYQVTHVSFNQLGTYMAMANMRGFQVFRMGEFLELIEDKPIEGGVWHVELLYETNIVFFVGSGLNP